jgi:carboxyl-terminal processing protease
VTVTRARPWILTAGLLAGLGAVMLAGCSGRAPGPQTAPIAPDLAVATFDTAWALIDRNHYDPDHGGVDWDAVREELRPRARTSDRDSLHAVLDEMIARTGLSHFGLIPREAATAMAAAGDARAGDGAGQGGRGGLGLHTRLVDGRVLVTDVDPGSPADSAGVRPGWVLEGVGETTFADLIASIGESLEPAEREMSVWSAAKGLLRAAVGSEVTITVADAGSDRHTLTLTRAELPGTVNKLGNMPPLNARLDHRWEEHGGLRVGVIRFNIWLLPVAAEFDAAVDRYREADGIVIDLRGNLGGVGGMAMGLAGHFLDQRVSLGEMRTRQTSLQFRVNPRLTTRAGERVEPYGGPLAILQDGLSMSTSEIFAQGLQAHGRARVFGTTSGGQALPSRLETLPSGDILQFAFADFVGPEGVRLEGRGVIPDQEVPLRRDDLLAGRDAVLDAALAWIADQHRTARD